MPLMSIACTIGAFLIPVKPRLLTALDVVETPCKPNAETLHSFVKTNVRAVFIVPVLIYIAFVFGHNVFYY